MVLRCLSVHPNLVVLEGLEVLVVPNSLSVLAVLKYHPYLVVLADPEVPVIHHCLATLVDLAVPVVPWVPVENLAVALEVDVASSLSSVKWKLVLA